MTPDPLSRKRWAARGVLALGVGGSVWANLSHARPEPAAWVWAGLAPVALFISIELIAWMPRTSGRLSKARLWMAVGIGLIAAWVSYGHQVSAVRDVGETWMGTEWLLPLVWDLLIGIGTICLVELSGAKPTTDIQNATVEAVSHETEANNESVALVAAARPGPTEVAKNAWAALGADADPNEVANYVKQIGREDARTAVYRVGKKLQPVANGVER